MDHGFLGELGRLQMDTVINKYRQWRHKTRNGRDGGTGAFYL
jgi:hypothetical protein